MAYKTALPSWNISGKRVFLRVDCNVPLVGSTIQDDLRLKEILPTIDYLRAHEAKIIIAGHIGRPTEYDPALSTRILIPWFQKHGYDIDFEADLGKAAIKSKQDNSKILLLDNLRFFPGEKDNNPVFAQSLLQLADLYINDAFGTLHRTDCSVYALPNLFEPGERTFGFLIQKELNQADNLFCHGKPFTLIMGGGKAKEKIPFIKQLLPHIDNLLLCPAIDVEFKENLNGVAIYRPTDYLVGKDLTTGPFITKTKELLSPQDFPISIGPATQVQYAQIIKNSKTCLYNGLMGTIATPETLQGVEAVFKAMSSIPFGMAAGGDSTAAADILGFSKSLHLSTGGGALIAYLSGQKLSALEILL